MREGLLLDKVLYRLRKKFDRVGFPIEWVAIFEEPFLPDTVNLWIKGHEIYSESTAGPWWSTRYPIRTLEAEVIQTTALRKSVVHGGVFRISTIQENL